MKEQSSRYEADGIRDDLKMWEGLEAVGKREQGGRREKAWLKAS